MHMRFCKSKVYRAKQRGGCGHGGRFAEQRKGKSGQLEPGYEVEALLQTALAGGTRKIVTPVFGIYHISLLQHLCQRNVIQGLEIEMENFKRVLWNERKGSQSAQAVQRPRMPPHMMVRFPSTGLSIELPSAQMHP